MEVDCDCDCEFCWPEDSAGWWAISGEAIMTMLRRAHAGEDPGLIYAEYYANCDHEDHSSGGDE